MIFNIQLFRKYFRWFLNYKKNCFLKSFCYLINIVKKITVTLHHLLNFSRIREKINLDRITAPL